MTFTETSRGETCILDENEASLAVASLLGCSYETVCIWCMEWDVTAVIVRWMLLLDWNDGQLVWRVAENIDQ